MHTTGTTASGTYTVKSSYWVVANLMKDEIQMEVSQPSLDALFQALQKMNTSPKVKHILWRCLNDCLPVGETMRYMHLGRDRVSHVLFQCPYARLIWALSPIPAPPGGDWSHSLYENFYRILCLSLSDHDDERVRFM